MRPPAGADGFAVLKKPPARVIVGMQGVGAGDMITADWRPRDPERADDLGLATLYRLTGNPGRNVAVAAHRAGSIDARTLAARTSAARSLSASSPAGSHRRFA